MNFKILIMLVSSFYLFAGCIAFNSVDTPTEKKSENNGPAEPIQDMEVISVNETSATIDKAKGTAKKLITEAEKEASWIRKNAQLKADKIIEQANLNASESEKSAIEDASKIKIKSKKQFEKIADKIIENAKKSAADITSKADKGAEKVKKKAQALFKDAKIHTDKLKKKAEEYLKQKMEEADKIVATTMGKIKKQGDDDAKPVIANSILDQILKGMKNNDDKAFTSHFTSEMKANFTKKRVKTLFSQLKEKIGELKSRTYFGSLQKGPLRVYVWKAKFTKVKNNDLVIKLSLGELDGKEQVFAFDISFL